MSESSANAAVRRELMQGRRTLPSAGAVVANDDVLLPFTVVDAEGAEIEPAVRYLRDRMLGDLSPLTCRSYGYDLLRWFRLLWLLDVDWDRATEAETAVMVGWLGNSDNPQRRRLPGSPRPGSVNVRTGKPEPGVGYSAATIAHELTVVSGLYDFHMHFGGGPLANPVPASASRRAALAHRSPLEEPGLYRRARLRPRMVKRAVRSIPDGLFEELFGQMHNDRDRALLALYVSSGARSAELLGLRMTDIDWAGRRIYVVSKGSRLREPIPASPDAFVYLACYLDKTGPPSEGAPVWRTLRGPDRPLTYWAMRQVLERANAALDTNWTLHDLRHTAAARLAADPRMTLVEIQVIMRHARLSTTQLYLTPRLDDMLDKLAEHYARPPAPSPWSAVYDPEDIRTVFGA